MDEDAIEDAGACRGNNKWHQKITRFERGGLFYALKVEWKVVLCRHEDLQIVNHWNLVASSPEGTYHAMEKCDEKCGNISRAK